MYVVLQKLRCKWETPLLFLQELYFNAFPEEIFPSVGFWQAMDEGGKIQINKPHLKNERKSKLPKNVPFKLFLHRKAPLS